MSTLAEHLDDYLRLRRGLGFQLGRHGEVLPRFVAYLDANGVATVTVELAVAWARLPEGIKPITVDFRVSAVRGFARYLHAIDPAHEIPPPGLLAVPRRRPLFLTRSGTRLSHDAIEHRLTRHLAIARTSCPSLRDKHVTMHTMRHTAAMRLLHAGIDIAVIALWLGHEQIGTANIYLHADMEHKERTISRVTPPAPPPGATSRPTRYSPSSTHSDCSDLRTAVRQPARRFRVEVGTITRSEQSAIGSPGAVATVSQERRPNDGLRLSPYAGSGWQPPPAEAAQRGHDDMSAWVQGVPRHRGGRASLHCWS